jgi:hypothetical protein
MAGFVVAQGLLRIAKVVVLLRYDRLQVQHVIDHCIDFVRQKHSQFLADHFHAERMDRTNDGVVRVVERLQASADILAQLPRDYSVEGDH